ncbi:MAG TPA: beta-ketoacyl-ACP synthase II [Polyangiaceae bacterium]|nr:beta-ketoacyl-ACP synthase II [Polyangiaceae bacterium]
MERVVITGIGLVTPNGIGTAESWRSITEGKSGIATITQFDATDYNSRIAGEVKGFEPTQFIEKKKVKEMARFVQLSVAASRLAIQDSHLELSDEDRERAGCFIGVGLGGLEGIEAMGRTLMAKGPSKISPYFIPSVIANLAAGQVSMAFGLRGPSYCNTSACSSSAHSIGEAFEWIRRGRADLIVAGGSESTITGLGVGGFCAMFALSRRNDEPARASRPFDTGRDGFVIGEGAGTLILESLTRAKKRGATIYGEVTGYGATSDAYHLTRPAPEGEGAQRAMRMALEDAKLDPSKIDYINAHGTSTPPGDIEESRAIERVFGDTAVSKKLWVSSTKSMMGHLLGGAGAVEAALSTLAIVKGLVPPTINLEDQDPECRLDYVPNQARERRIEHAMSNSFGFGGTNASLVLSRFSA